MRQLSSNQENYENSVVLKNLVDSLRDFSVQQIIEKQQGYYYLRIDRFYERSPFDFHPNYHSQQFLDELSQSYRSRESSREPRRVLDFKQTVKFSQNERSIQLQCPNDLRQLGQLWDLELHQKVSKYKEFYLKRQYSALPMSRLNSNPDPDSRNTGIKYEGERSIRVEYYQEYRNMTDEQICRVYLKSDQFQILS